MAVKRGSFTIGSTGNVQVVGLTFLPTNVDFFMSGRFGTDETREQYSNGGMTSANQNVDALFDDSTGKRSRSFTDRCINLYERVSGNITGKVVATYVSFDSNGGGDFGFTINASAADSNYQVKFKASDE